MNYVVSALAIVSFSGEGQNLGGVWDSLEVNIQSRSYLLLSAFMVWDHTHNANDWVPFDVRIEKLNKTREKMT